MSESATVAALVDLKAAELAYWRARAVDCKGVAHRFGCDGQCRDQRIAAADNLVESVARFLRG